jgi:hypothetical protein
MLGFLLYKESCTLSRKLFSCLVLASGLKGDTGILQVEFIQNPPFHLILISRFVVVRACSELGDEQINLLFPSNNSYTVPSMVLLYFQYRVCEFALAIACARGQPVRHLIIS